MPPRARRHTYRRDMHHRRRDSHPSARRHRDSHQRAPRHETRRRETHRRGRRHVHRRRARLRHRAHHHRGRRPLPAHTTWLPTMSQQQCKSFSVDMASLPLSSPRQEFPPSFLRYRVAITHPSTNYILARRPFETARTGAFGNIRRFANCVPKRSIDPGYRRSLPMRCSVDRSGRSGPIIPARKAGCRPEMNGLDRYCQSQRWQSS